MKVKRALISVSDKRYIDKLGWALTKLGVEIISTGGTAKALLQAGVPIIDASEFTGWPEMFEGRLKTLHPLIHGGILFRRGNEEDQRQAAEHGVVGIDLVVVNLYPFAATVAKEGVTFEDAVENIDIGGPTMVRAAGKNYEDVAVVVDSGDYEALIEELEFSGGNLSLMTRFSLMSKAFAHTAAYDSAIADFIANRATFNPGTEKVEVLDAEAMPARVTLQLRRKDTLRYGENPHQKSALYTTAQSDGGVAAAVQIQGKGLSMTNYLDMDAAWKIVGELAGELVSFQVPCAIVKHATPCGVAIGATQVDAYIRAFACDPKSAFGGVIAFDDVVDGDAARAVLSHFVEVVIATDYTDEALEEFQRKPNVRVMRAPNAVAEPFELRSISGGLLFQQPDTDAIHALSVVTERQPTEFEENDLWLANMLVKYVKSNGIVYVRDQQMVAVCGGQTSRVDAVRMAGEKAVLPLAGSVLASDAFFPFRDNVDEAAKAGVTAIIQPGGSNRDQEVIDTANENDMAMIFTGTRHFRH